MNKIIIFRKTDETETIILRRISYALKDRYNVSFLPYAHFIYLGTYIHLYMREI